MKNLQFHHNYVDNFNDDGLECGPKLRDHTLFIYQNHIGRCLIPLAQHEIEPDESPLDHDPGSGVYLFRNVIDQPLALLDPLALLGKDGRDAAGNPARDRP